MFLEFLQRGGPALWLLLVCSIIGVSLFLRRLLFFHQNRFDTTQFLQGIRVLIQKQEFGRAIQECATTHGPLPRLLRAAIAHRHLALADLRETIRSSIQLELPELERSLGALLALVVIAPLIGLLGTVLALLETFAQLEESSLGLISPAQLSQGMYQSLLCSALGLIVAIVLYLAYQVLRTRALKQLRELECAGIEVSELLLETKTSSEIRAEDHSRQQNSSS